jgi:outer membrane protein assembly factor BamB
MRIRHWTSVIVGISFALLTIAVVLYSGANRVVSSSDTTTAGDTSSANWPMYRGDPALVGVAMGSLSDQLALRWTFKTEGPVKSSAAIENGMVYVGSDDGQVYALDLRHGQKQWAFKTGGPVESSPLLLAEGLYVGSSDAMLYALSKPMASCSGNMRPATAF